MLKIISLPLVADTSLSQQNVVHKSLRKRALGKVSDTLGRGNCEASSEYPMLVMANSPHRLHAFATYSLDEVTPSIPSSWIERSKYACMRTTLFVSTISSNLQRSYNTASRSLRFFRGIVLSNLVAARNTALSKISGD